MVKVFFGFLAIISILYAIACFIMALGGDDDFTLKEEIIAFIFGIIFIFVSITLVKFGIFGTLPL